MLELARLRDENVYMDAKSVAVVDTDALYGGRLAAAVERLGVPARAYESLAAADAEAPAQAGYVLGLSPTGTPELVRRLGRQGHPAILVLSEGAKVEAIHAAIGGGAALHVTKSKAVQDVAASVAATLRLAWQRNGLMAWQLDRGARQLVVPDGARIDLSVDELRLLGCFVHSLGRVVSHSAVAGPAQAGAAPSPSDAVYAAMLRLQRRAERLTPTTLPFRVWSRSGYSFEGHLEEV